VSGLSEQKIIFKCPNNECLEANGFNIVNCENCFKRAQEEQELTEKLNGLNDKQIKLLLETQFSKV
jgi:hypothetical protein